MHVYILLAIWFAGAATAGGALFIPVYTSYVIVGAIGWIILSLSTVLIFYEMKRIRAEDRKKEMA
jgi:hypothetical protein